MWDLRCRGGEWKPARKIPHLAEAFTNPTHISMCKLQVCGIYVAGVVSGSLATSLTDPQALLAGASGPRDSTFRTVPQVLEISGHGGSKWVIVSMI